MTFSVLISDALAPAATEALKKRGAEVLETTLSPDELVAEIGNHDALLIRSATKVTRAVLEAGAPRLKVIGRAGVGVDNVDLAAAKELGVVVVNAPTASTDAVAELTLAHMLALARNLQPADASTRAGKWEKKAFMGVELGGRTLVLLGVGRIGARVAELAKAFRMRVVAFDPFVDAERARVMGVEKAETVLEAVRLADFVSIHAPLTPDTKDLVNEEILAAMKPTAFLVNCARGGIIDEVALAEALRKESIGGCALDVYAEEPAKENALFAEPRARFTPHIGASTEEAQDKAGVMVAEDAMNVLEGKSPASRVA